MVLETIQCYPCRQVGVGQGLRLRGVDQGSLLVREQGAALSGLHGQGEWSVLGGQCFKQAL